MYGKMLLFLSVIMLQAVLVMAAQDNGSKGTEPKELSGMSIVGNDEAPKSLYIVPWKSSELGVETSLKRMLNDDDGPVDRDVFLRQLEFYEVSRAQPNAPPQVAGQQN